jgi:hypothetical protein
VHGGRLARQCHHDVLRLWGKKHECRSSDG